jgi:anti-anti-sigma factor
MLSVLNENDAVPLIRLDGEVDIESASELKGLLLKALAAGKGLRINLEKATGLDIAVMQLLVATERDVAKSNTRFSLEGQVPDEISVALAHAGFRKFPVPVGSR